jgi:hypothetical protein
VARPKNARLYLSRATIMATGLRTVVRIQNHSRIKLTPFVNTALFAMYTMAEGASLMGKMGIVARLLFETFWDRRPTTSLSKNTVLGSGLGWQRFIFNSLFELIRPSNCAPISVTRLCEIASLGLHVYLSNILSPQKFYYLFIFLKKNTQGDVFIISGADNY